MVICDNSAVIYIYIYICLNSQLWSTVIFEALPWIPIAQQSINLWHSFRRSAACASQAGTGSQQMLKYRSKSRKGASYIAAKQSTSSIPESNLWSTVLDSNKSIARFLKQVLAHAASNAPNGCVKIRDFKAIVVYGAKIHVINNLKYHGWTTGSCIPCIPHFENQQKKGLFSQYCDPVPVTISVTNDIFGCHFEPYPLVNDGKRLHNIWKDLPFSMGKSG